jgi:hypothetical protein
MHDPLKPVRSSAELVFTHRTRVYDQEGTVVSLIDRQTARVLYESGKAEILGNKSRIRGLRLVAPYKAYNPNIYDGKRLGFAASKWPT